MARRKQASLLDAVFELSIILPVWANVLLAVGSFVGLRMIGGAEVPVNQAGSVTGMVGYVGRVFAHYGQFCVPLIFVIGGCLGAWKRSSRSRLFNRVAGSGNVGGSVRDLSWDDFERLTAEAFARLGYVSHETRKGRDDGIDCVLRKDGKRYLAQCKHWKSGKVGVQVVRELFGVVVAQGAAGGFVVCSGEFTADAKEFAKGTTIELVDGRKLARWFAGAERPAAPEIARPAPAGAAPAHAPAPQDCPRCGSPMVARHRKASGGAIAAPVFLGCVNFPKCRGTRQLG